MKTPEQISNAVIEAHYGADTEWEEPNDFGEEGFTRAQAESDIDADQIRDLIEEAIKIDRADNVVTPVTKSTLDDRLLTAVHEQAPELDEQVARQLVEGITAVLVPEHHLLVTFEAVTERESGDWESCQPSYDITDLGSPKILHHNLVDDELARLYFQIEMMGGLQESDAYRDLDRAIEQLGEEPAARARDKADAPGPFPLFDQQTGA